MRAMQIVAVTRLLEVCPKVAFILGALASLYNLTRVLTSPLDVLIQFVPDDAFYYIEVGRNLAAIGKSSFDGGQTTTTGYHLLWALIVCCIGWMARFDRMTMLRSMILLSGLLAFGTALWAARKAWNKDPLALSVLTLGVTSLSFLSNSVSAMEWSLTLMISSASWILLSRQELGATRSGYLLLLTGALGSAARSDYGGQSVGFVCGAILVWVLRRDRRYVVPAVLSLTGSSLGLALCFWWNHHWTGNFIQGSARMKAMWSSTGGNSSLPFFPVIARTLFYIPAHSPHSLAAIVSSIHGRPTLGGVTMTSILEVISLGGIALILSGVIVFILRSGARNSKAVEGPRTVFFLGAAASTIELYSALYSLDSYSVQLWYSVGITIPLLILFYFLVKYTAGVGRQLLACSLICLAGFANLSVFAEWPLRFEAQMNNPKFFTILKQSLAQERIGIADSGIANFIWGGGIINLDGMMNDEIYRFAPDRLPCYLVEKNVRYFSGFGEKPFTIFHLQPYTDYAKELQIRVRDRTETPIYRVDEDKIRALPACRYLTEKLVRP